MAPRQASTLIKSSFTELMKLPANPSLDSFLLEEYGGARSWALSLVPLSDTQLLSFLRTGRIIGFDLQGEVTESIQLVYPAVRLVPLRQVLVFLDTKGQIGYLNLLTREVVYLPDIAAEGLLAYQQEVVTVMTTDHRHLLIRFRGAEPELIYNDKLPQITQLAGPLVVTAANRLYRTRLVERTIHHEFIFGKAEWIINRGNPDDVIVMGTDQRLYQSYSFKGRMFFLPVSQKCQKQLLEVERELRQKLIDEALLPEEHRAEVDNIFWATLFFYTYRDETYMVHPYPGHLTDVRKSINLGKGLLDINYAGDLGPSHSSEFYALHYSHC